MSGKTSVKTASVNGEQTLIANLKMYQKNMNGAVADGMRKFGGRVEAESDRNCPVITGELRSRVFNEGPLKDGKQYAQVIGYEKFGATWGKENPETSGRPYALAVHERTHSQSAVGGPKFLQRAVDTLSGDYAKYMQKILGQVRL